MTFKFGEMDFSVDFPTSEAIQREWTNLSGLGIESLEIPRMEHRRFLETTRPRTSQAFDVILHGDSEAEVEEARQRFLRFVDPTLGPLPLILDEDPDWYWTMTVSNEIVWERLTWACHMRGYRLRATVVFESYNDAAQRLVDEEPTPAVMNYAPEIMGSGKWAEVARFPTGSTPPAFAQPEDFRVRDLGTGESVMEIEQVEGLTASSGVAGVSTRNGKPAVRIINTTGARPTTVYLRFNLPEAVRAGGTFMAVRHQDEVLSDDTAADAYNIRVDSPTQFTPRTNTVGAVENRLVYSELSGTYRAYLSGRMTDGDVWWTDIGLYAGDYDGLVAPPGFGALVELEGNTRTWPTVQITGTLTEAQEVEAIIDDFSVRVAGPLTNQDVMVLDYLKMRFEVYRAGVKIASLVPRMSTLDRVEIRPQTGPVYFTAAPVGGGSVNSASILPNSRKQ